MPKFRLCFRVEQTLAGSIEFEAESAQAARALFEHPRPWECAAAQRVDDLRTDTKLDLDDSQDSIVDITNIDTGRVEWVESEEAQV